MAFDFQYPEERKNPDYKFDEVLSKYNYNFSLISTGSTDFTGNTSTTCIRELYVSNVHACSSALTIHGQIKHPNNTVIGNNSIALGENTWAGYFKDEVSEDFISACTINTDYGLFNYYLTVPGNVEYEWQQIILSAGPISVTLYGGTGSTLSYTFQQAFYDIGTDSTLLYDSALPDNDSTYTMFSGTIVYSSAIDNKNSFAGGVNSVASGDTSFVFSSNSTVSGARSAVIGGQGITGTNDDTVYVPHLNIGSINQNNSATNILTRETDGSITYRDSSTLGGSISYNNVIFVDPQYGNNTTGLVERLDKPYQDVSTALSYASSLSPSSTNRILIYLRAGYYSFGIILVDNVDIYCEPGVVIYGAIQDSGPVNCNFLGHAKFLSYPLNSLSITYSSTINFEFDEIQSSGRAMNLGGSGSNFPTIRIKGNYIYCSTVGTGHGITIRNNANVYIDITRGIEAVHSTIEFRNHSGDFVLNCPKLYLGTGNIYGGNYKQALILYSSTINSNVIINADIVNKDTLYYGGISGMITLWGSCAGSVTINGNVYGRGTVGVLGNNTTTGKFTMNGSVFSDIEPGALYGNGEYYFKNGTHGMPSSATTVNRLYYIFQNAKVYFNNALMYNDIVDSNIIELASTTCSVSMFNTLATTAGSSGQIISATTSGNTIMFHNIRSNKPLNANLTDTLSPTGLIVDTNLVIPKF
jgi:hypothetical protein